MSRCSKLRDVFEDHYVCHQCDRDKFDVGDTLIYEGRPHRVSHRFFSGSGYRLYQLETIPSDASPAELAYMKLTSLEPLERISAYNIVGNKAYLWKSEVIFFVGFLNNGSVVLRHFDEGLSFTEFRDVKKLRGAISKILHTTVKEDVRDRYTVVLDNHKGHTPETIFKWI